MLAPACAFVDVETTGTTATEDRITEIGIVRVLDGRLEEEWSTLVNPEVAVPAEIQLLTGISNAMLADAPTFAEVRHRVLDRLEDHLFIAHNARFDYGFLKNEFRRAGTRFSADVLCTVRLSRRLYPEHREHHLDALIERHLLQCGQRHRALPDARVLWDFVRAVRADKDPGELEAAVRHLLRTPSLPPQLAPDALARLPEGPGVYLFYGVNDLPLYVGKSRSIRARVRAHFSGDHLSPADLRISSEVTHIECQETAGEVGALLREAELVKALEPHHNRLLRRRRGCALRLPAEPGPPVFVKETEFSVDDAQGLYGPFASRPAARGLLMDLAAEHGLCWTELRLERRRAGPCFSRQIRRCRGACVGAESREAHHERLREALEKHRIPAWPWPGPMGLLETGEDGRQELHVFDRWCHLGTAHADFEVHEALERRPGSFDLDTYRIIAFALRRPPRRARLVRLQRRE